MNAKREQMVYDVMRYWGYESQTAIIFAEIADTWESDFAVENMYKVAMAVGYEPEEDDEEE